MVDFINSFPQLLRHQLLVCLMYFGQKSEMFVYQVIAVNMIMVGVGQQQTDGMQMLCLNVLQQMAPLVRIIDATIHNHCLSRLVRKYMRTFLAGICHPLLQFNHNAASLSFRMSTPVTAVVLICSKP